MLKLNNISKAFDGTDFIFKNLSYEFLPGKVVCLFGPSGCGKSTLLRTIAGIERLTSGAIEYDGKSVFDIEMHEYFSKTCSFVSQKPALIFDLTVGDYFNVVNGVLSEQSSEKFISNVQAEFEIDNLRDSYVNSLSGGQKQRLAIAIAMLGVKKIFLLDEPTAHLDYKLAKVVFDFFKSFVKRCNGIAIVASHDRWIKNCCDNIIESW